MSNSSFNPMFPFVYQQHHCSFQDTRGYPMEHTLGNRLQKKRVWALESRKIWVECCVASGVTSNLSELETRTPSNERGSWRLKVVQIKHLAPGQ